MGLQADPRAVEVTESLSRPQGVHGQPVQSLLHTLPLPPSLDQPQLQLLALLQETTKTKRQTNRREKMIPALTFCPSDS